MTHVNHYLKNISCSRCYVPNLLPSYITVFCYSFIQVSSSSPVEQVFLEMSYKCLNHIFLTCSRKAPSSLTPPPYGLIQPLQLTALWSQGPQLTSSQITMATYFLNFGMFYMNSFFAVSPSTPNCKLGRQRAVLCRSNIKYAMKNFSNFSLLAG